MLPDLLDILIITETKLDGSFPEQQFHIESFNIPFRLDRNRYGRVVLLYVHNNTNAVLLRSCAFLDNIEVFFMETLLKCDMVKQELRVGSLKARVESLKARVKIQKCEFKSTG